MSLKVNTPGLCFNSERGDPTQRVLPVCRPGSCPLPWLRLRVFPVLSSLRISRAPGVTHAANTTNTSLALWPLGPAVTKLCRTLWFVGDRRITLHTKHSDILHKMMIWSITWLDRNKIIDTPHVSGPGGVVLIIDWPRESGNNYSPWWLASHNDAMYQLEQHQKWITEWPPMLSRAEH